jgi:lincosamide nucleotidyltransferase A/C/D/E
VEIVRLPFNLYLKGNGYRKRLLKELRDCMVNETDAIEIIAYAEKNGIAIWIDGGWGVDALLEEETRVHNDIDLFVEESNSKKFVEILKERSFVEHIQPHLTRFGRIPKVE